MRAPLVIGSGINLRDNYGTVRTVRNAEGELVTYTHYATDLYAPEGSPILAPENGEVTEDVGDNTDAGGFYFHFRSEGGFERYYVAHCALPVRPGRYAAGQQIGAVGKTGNAGPGYRDRFGHWHEGRHSEAHAHTDFVLRASGRDVRADIFPAMEWLAGQTTGRWRHDGIRIPMRIAPVPLEVLQRCLRPSDPLPGQHALRARSSVPVTPLPDVGALWQDFRTWLESGVSAALPGSR